MIEFLSVYYPWLKIAHLIAVIAWMVGLLYLPRLYAYHAEVEVGSGEDEVFKKMEHRLLLVLMNPAMLVVFVVGILLIIVTGAGGPGSGGWMHAKLLLTLIMGGLQGMLSRVRRTFAHGENTRSASFYRRLHWVFIILMVAVVFLAVRKPF
jgi:putative membrane protein